MRIKNIFFAAVIFLAACNVNSGDKQQEAVDYNESAMGIQWQVTDYMDSITQHVEEDNLVQAEQYRVRCMFLCDSAVAILRQKGPLHGDDSYQLALIKYFELMKMLFETESVEIMQLWAKSLELDKTDDYKQNNLVIEKINALSDTIDNKAEKYLADLKLEQTHFAIKYNFTIDKNQQPASQNIP